MDILSKDAAMQAIHRAGMQGDIAIAYTVWAKKKGGGRAIVNEVYKMVKDSNHLNRLVTLSPLTDMARNFHLKNGAKELQVNDTTQNFEYDITLEDWEKYLERAKGWFKIR
jgi:predicted regulator of amino acid metabolism with ACT domain